MSRLTDVHTVVIVVRNTRLSAIYLNRKFLVLLDRTRYVSLLYLRALRMFRMYIIGYGFLNTNFTSIRKIIYKLAKSYCTRACSVQTNIILKIITPVSLIYYRGEYTTVLKCVGNTILYNAIIICIAHRVFIR